MRIRRLIVAAGVSLALVGGVISSIPAASAVPSGSTGHKPASYTPPPIQWGACASATLAKRNAQCGFVVVPLDYDHPGGTKIKLAVSRVMHKTPDSQAQGPMLSIRAVSVRASRL